MYSMFIYSIWIPLHSTNWTLGVPESTCYDENTHFESDCLQSQATRWLGTLRTIDWKELWYRAKRRIYSLLGLSYGFWNLLLTMSRYSRFPYGPPSHPTSTIDIRCHRKHILRREKEILYFGWPWTINGLGNRFGKHLMQDEMKYRVSLTDNPALLNYYIAFFLFNTQSIHIIPYPLSGATRYDSNGSPTA